MRIQHITNQSGTQECYFDLCSIKPLSPNLKPSAHNNKLGYHPLMTINETISMNSLKGGSVSKRIRQNDIEKELLKAGSLILGVICIMLGAIFLKLLELEHKASIKTSNKIVNMQRIIIPRQEMAEPNWAETETFNSTINMSNQTKLPMGPNQVPVDRSGKLQQKDENFISSRQMKAAEISTRQEKKSIKPSSFLVIPNTTMEAIGAILPEISNSGDAMIFQSFSQMREFENLVFPIEIFLNSIRKKHLKSEYPVSTQLT